MSPKAKSAAKKVPTKEAKAAKPAKAAKEAKPAKAPKEAKPAKAAKGGKVAAPEPAQAAPINEDDDEDEAMSSSSGGGGSAAALAAASSGTESASFKNFRHSPDMENFYRFIFENDLRVEALDIMNELFIEKAAKKAAKLVGKNA